MEFEKVINIIVSDKYLQYTDRQLSKFIRQFKILNGYKTSEIYNIFRVLKGILVQGVYISRYSADIIKNYIIVFNITEKQMIEYLQEAIDNIYKYRYTFCYYK